MVSLESGSEFPNKMYVVHFHYRPRSADVFGSVSVYITKTMRDDV